MSNEYWEASLNELLPEHDVLPTKELINDIVMIREMESEACGHFCIPNPDETEAAKLKKVIRQMGDKYDTLIRGACKNIALEKHIDERYVHISSEGEITYGK